MTPAELGIPDMKHGDTAGYVVLTYEHGRFKDDWDGEVHSTIEEGRRALRDCSNAGWFCFLMACVYVPGSDDQTKGGSV